MSCLFVRGKSLYDMPVSVPFIVLLVSCQLVNLLISSFCIFSMFLLGNFDRIRSYWVIFDFMNQGSTGGYYMMAEGSLCRVQGNQVFHKFRDCFLTPDRGQRQRVF